MKTTVLKQFSGPVNGVCPCSNPDYPCYAYYQTGCSGALGYQSVGRSTVCYFFSQSYFPAFGLHISLAIQVKKLVKGPGEHIYYVTSANIFTTCHIVLCLQVDFALASKSIA